MSQFFADCKFDVVIGHLESQGWTRAPEKSIEGLVWTNLKNVDWDAVLPFQPVNHLRGSQHLSNKAFLAYHMETSNFKDDMPLQWSSAYQDMAQLIGMATVDALHSLAVYFLLERELDSSSTPGVPKDHLRDLTKLKAVANILQRDEDFAKSVDSQLVKDLLSLLELVLDGRSTGLPSTTLRQVLRTMDESNPRFKYAGRENVWIVKPVGLSCGANIKIAQGLGELLSIVNSEMNYKCVVQKYIERPLLVKSGKHKFDIRQWILVTSVSPLVIYGFSEFYCRVSSREYCTSAASLKDPTVHLTNHSIQKTSGAGEETPGRGSKTNPGNTPLEMPLDCSTMLTQEQFEADLREMASRRELPDHAIEFANNGESIVAKVLLPQIKAIALHTVSCVRDKIEKVGAGFEWLGLDLMVTDSLQVLLIECNVSPDISLSTPVTARIVTAAVKELFPIIMPTDFLPSRCGSGCGVSGSPAQPASASALAWQQWYPSGAEEPLSSKLLFARTKREKGIILGSDHIPKKLDIFQKTMQVLDQKGAESAEDDDDEI